MVWGRLSIVCSLTLGILLSGCKQPSGIVDKPYGDSLIIVTYHAPGSINPLTTVSGISAALQEVIFDGLVKIDETLKAMPHLASSWHTSDNDLKWTFHLRKGVKFHDGVEFTAGDVKFTIEQFLQSDTGNFFAGGLRDIQSIHIRDRYTIDFILKRPSIFFLYSMKVSILPAHILKDKDSKDYDLGRPPVGTGPFKLADWGKEDIVLETNRDYFSGRPYLNRIVVKVYPNQETAWARLMQGKGDFLVPPVDPSGYSFLNQISFMQAYSTQGLYYTLIAFNNDSKLFYDKRVRVALNYAINKGHIIHNILKGNGRVAEGTIWPRVTFC